MTLKETRICDSVSPAVMTTIFSSLKMVSVYSVYNMVMAGINGVMSVFSTGVSAGFGELIVKKDKTAFQKAYSDFEYLYYFMVNICYGTNANKVYANKSYYMVFLRNLCWNL